MDTQIEICNNLNNPEFIRNKEKSQQEFQKENEEEIRIATEKQRIEREEHEKRIKENTQKKMEPKPKGNAELVTFNPGAVRYEDLKAFLEKQNAERYKSNNNI